jgi:hypothetical protein
LFFEGSWRSLLRCHCIALHGSLSIWNDMHEAEAEEPCLLPRASTAVESSLRRFVFLQFFFPT